MKDRIEEFWDWYVVKYVHVIDFVLIAWIAFLGWIFWGLSA